MMPTYPVYIISKGRPTQQLTARFMIEDGCQFRVVVEPQETEAYAAEIGADRVLTLPFSNLGLGGIPARNWVWEHSKAEGHRRHWILDDNIRHIHRRWKARRLRCAAQIAFAITEQFVDRYENIAIAGMNYSMFSPAALAMPPFYLNCHVYSCLLIDNALPYRWRGRYNEDTDLCLQVLAGGLCTVLMNAFLIQKIKTMTMKGGNAAELYKGDGRLKMARSLERAWPYVVEVKRRFQRPQHVVHDAWRKFDTQLIRRKDVDFDTLTPNEFGMKLEQVADEIKSPRYRGLVEEHRALRIEEDSDEREEA